MRRRRSAGAVLLVAVLAVLLAVGGSLLDVAAGHAPRADTVPHGVTVAVVHEGESLVDLARRSAPGADVDWAVRRIRALNALTGSVLEPGRPLLVPTG